MAHCHALKLLGAVLELVAAHMTTCAISLAPTFCSHNVATRDGIVCEYGVCFSPQAVHFALCCGEVTERRLELPAQRHQLRIRRVNERLLAAQLGSVGRGGNEQRAEPK